jgi:hypothetical protein
MNLDNLQRKLLAAARAARPSEQVPYAFEKRIMARLAESTGVDLLSAWGVALWRAAVGCVGIVLLSAAFSLWANHHQTKDLSQEFEIAVFAGASSVDDVQ